MTNEKDSKIIHKPVLSDEVLSLLTNNLAHLDGFKIIDATVGFGGHAKSFLQKGACLLGIDIDEESLSYAGKCLNLACPAPINNRSSFQLIQGNFKDIDKIAEANGFSGVNAVLLDLGVNTHQLKSKKRGFSFNHPDSSLDMRMSPETQGVRAADLLNTLDKNNLMDLFEESLGYKESLLLVSQILEKRKSKLFLKISDLLEIVGNLKKSKKKINPATKIFMALRIAVNSELDNLKEALPKCMALVKSGGRIAVISFHSQEDRIVKNYFRLWFEQGLGRIVTKKPIIPKPLELLINPRSRSAKLRVFEKKYD